MPDKSLFNLCSEDFHLIYAPDTHNALCIKPKISLTDWPYSINNEIARHPQKPIAIITNSIDPLSVKALDFSWIHDLPLRDNLIIVIDDSHGIGVTGRVGNGFYQSISARTQLPIVSVGSLGKALSIPAGFITGPKSIVERVYNHPLFIGSSTPCPAYLYAMINAREIYDVQLNKLRQNIHYFMHANQGLPAFNYLTDYPVFHSSNPDLFKRLQNHRIICSSFNYPTPNSPALTRIVINACHQKEDLLMLKNVIEGVQTLF